MRFRVVDLDVSRPGRTFIHVESQRLRPLRDHRVRLHIREHQMIARPLYIHAVVIEPVHQEVLKHQPRLPADVDHRRIGQPHWHNRLVVKKRRTLGGVYIQVPIRRIKIPLRRQIRVRSHNLLPPDRTEQTKIQRRKPRSRQRRLPHIPRHMHPARTRHRVISRQIRRRPRPIGVKRNRISRSPRRRRRQTLIPHISPLEQNRISRLKGLRVHLRNRLPGRIGRSPAVRIAPRTRTHVVRRPRRGTTQPESHDGDCHPERSKPIRAANQLA